MSLRSAAAQAGMPYADFWRSTPGVIVDFLTDSMARTKEGYQMALYAAWHAALFNRTSKFPGFEEVFGLEPEEKTEQELTDKMDRIFKRFGGE